MAAQTGISGGNLQAMRRASAPAMVDGRNQFKEGYRQWTNSLIHEVDRSSSKIFEESSHWL